MSWIDRLFGRDRHEEPPCPLRFALAEWRRDRQAAAPPWRWRDPAGDALVVAVLPGGAEAAAVGASLEDLRAAWREQAALSGAAIVEVERATVASRLAQRVITKARQGHGSAYTGRFELAIGAERYEVRVEAAEHGVTGQREALVSAAMAQSDELAFAAPASPGEPTPIVGWFQDPYDAAFDRAALNSVTDDERLDAIVPDHPLSKVRAVLHAIATTATIDPAMAGEPASPPGTSDEPPAPRRGRMAPRALGLLCLQAGYLSQSEDALREAVAELEAGGRRQEPVMAQQLLLLGFACSGQGRHQEALEQFQRAEQVAASLDPRHRFVGQAITNQARMWIALEQHDAAEPLLTRALALFESDAEAGTMTAVALNGLAIVRNRQQRYEEAIPLLNRALGIFEREHGAEYRDAGEVWAHLAVAYDRLGDAYRARYALSRAQAILGAR